MYFQHSDPRNPGIFAPFWVKEIGLLYKKVPRQQVFCNEGVLHLKLHGWLNCLLVAFFMSYGKDLQLAGVKPDRRTLRIGRKCATNGERRPRDPVHLGCSEENGFLMRLFCQIKSRYFQAFQ